MGYRMGKRKSGPSAYRATVLAMRGSVINEARQSIYSEARHAAQKNKCTACTNDRRVHVTRNEDICDACGGELQGPTFPELEFWSKFGGRLYI